MQSIDDAIVVSRHAEGRIVASRLDGVGFLVFNHPERRNAVTIDMWTGVGEVLDRYAADSSIRVVVLAGAGDRAFVSGGDISQFEANRSSAEANLEFQRRTARGREALAAFPKPTIAALRGYCLGGGFGIALEADLRIASRTARFGIPAARLGIAYGLRWIGKLVDLVGPAHARMILYTGSQIDADEALRIGLVNRVVDDGQLDRTVLDVALGIADNAPLSIAASKFTIDQVLKDPAARDLEEIERFTERCMNSSDYAEGRRAFMEKRKPRFTGE